VLSPSHAELSAFLRTARATTEPQITEHEEEKYSGGLRRLDGLPGHPDVVATPEVVASTGSLGMGVSKARGFV